MHNHIATSIPTANQLIQISDAQQIHMEMHQQQQHRKMKSSEKELQ